MTATLRFGIHTSALLKHSFRHLFPSQLAQSGSALLRDATIPHGTLTRTVNLSLAVLGLLFWIGAGLLAGLGPASWRGKATFAIVFGPPGTVLRFYLSRLNAARSSFPIGTFIANMVGTTLIGVFVLLQYKANVVQSVLSCAALQGFDDVRLYRICRSRLL